MPKPKKVAEERPVAYPEIQVSRAWGEEALTAEQAKILLGWETEKEYVARRLAEDPSLKEEEASFGGNWKLRDEEGNKVQCWRCDHNRPFDEQWSRRLAQDVLNRNWAGPTTMPGETINGETVVISKYKAVESGQHRLIALVLADQLWRGKSQSAHWQTKWADPPVLETLIVYGVSESAKVLQTLDNTKPRSLSDTIYTSDIFADLNEQEKKEASRMLAAATNLLWDRVGAGASSYEKYQTASTSQGFISRHKKLIDLVRFLFDLNKDRSISGLHLSPGQSAAVCYLMASSTTDGDIYRSLNPPSEKKIEFEYLDKAKEFWTELAKSADKKSKEHKSMGPVRYAIGRLVDDSSGLGGRLSEKLIVISRAWEIYKLGHKLTDAQVAMQESDYQRDEQGALRLKSTADFGGIDNPSVPSDQEPSEEELERRKAEERKNRENRIKALAEANKKRREAKKATKDAAKNGQSVPAEEPAPTEVNGTPEVAEDQTEEVT